MYVFTLDRLSFDNAGRETSNYDDFVRALDVHLSSGARPRKIVISGASNETMMDMTTSAVARLPDLKAVSLERLVSDRDAGEKLADAFRTRNLEELSITDSNLGDADLLPFLQLVEAQPDLKELSISGTRMSDASASLLASILTGRRQPEILRLDRNRLTAAGASLLARPFSSNTNLQLLDIEDNPIGHDGLVALLEALAETGSIETLLASRTASLANAPRGIASLKALPKLRGISLSDNNLGAEGMQAVARGLSASPELEDIYINHNQLGEDGSRILTDLIWQSKKLKILSARANEIGDAAPFLAGALLQNTGLQLLDLSDNDLGPDGIRPLADTVARLRKLELLRVANCGLGTDGGAHLCQAISGKKLLRYLSVDANQMGKEGGLALGDTLESLTGLKGISLSSNDMDGGTAPFIGEGLEACNQLESFDGSNNPFGKRVDAIFNGLRAASGLRKIELSRAGIHGADLKELPAAAEYWPDLRELSLSGNLLGDDMRPLTATLRTSRRLAVLKLSDIGLTPQAAYTLLPSLTNHRMLESLDLANNNIGDVGGPALASIIHNSPKLRQMSIGGCRIGRERMGPILAALASQSRLEEVGLSGNSISPSDMTTFASSLPQLPALRKISVSQTGLTDETRDALVSQVMNCPALGELYMSDDGIEDPWAPSVVALRVQKPAIGLHLHEDEIASGSSAGKRYRQLSSISDALEKGALDGQLSKLVARQLPSIQLFLTNERGMSDAQAQRLFYRNGFLLEQVNPLALGNKRVQALTILDPGNELTLNGAPAGLGDRLMLARDVSRSSINDFNLALEQIDAAIQKLIRQHSAAKTIHKDAERNLRDAGKDNAKIDRDIAKHQMAIDFGQRRWDAVSSERLRGVYEKPLANIGTKFGLYAAGGFVVAATGGLAAPIVGSVLAGLAFKDLSDTVADGVDDYVEYRHRNRVEHTKMLSERDYEQALIAALRKQRVDVDAAGAAITAIAADLKRLSASQVEQADRHAVTAFDRLANGLLMERIIERGLNLTRRIEENRVFTRHFESIDHWITALDDERLKMALTHLCLGRADTGDMHVILEESHAVAAGEADPAKQVFDTVVERMIKPDIDDFLKRASMVDFAEDAGLLNPHVAKAVIGNELEDVHARQIQQATRFAIQAMFADQAEVSHVGIYDIRRLFSFYLHRHGNHELSDTQIEDGRISYQGDHFADKKVSVIEPREADRFRERFKRAYSYRDQQPPKIGDLFLRICAYEYYLPQAVHAGGGAHRFADHPEAPIGIVMANTVVQEFVKRITSGGMAEYHEKVGEKIDAVVAQSFFDFFATMGRRHRREFAEQREQLRSAYHHDDASTMFTAAENDITDDALNHFDLFAQIYRHNLEKAMQVAPKNEIAAFSRQIKEVGELSGDGLPAPDSLPGSEMARLRARRPSREQYGENMTESWRFRVDQNDPSAAGFTKA